MLPMRFMPVQGEVPAWEWDMKTMQPSVAVLPVWEEAKVLAQVFWKCVQAMA
ncbi:MAG: hypothetical protein ITG01_11055 [Comamonas sp.]|nr:hypothetical protein [Comamonas sp.]